MKNHLKRVASPKTWAIAREGTPFITRPNPGAHSLAMGLPLGVILRDSLQLASTMAEVKRIVHFREILIDGKRQRDPRFLVGLFDVISIKDMNKNYRVVLDQKGRLTIIEIDAKESVIKPCKIIGKKMVSKGKVQLNLHDGKNVIATKEAAVGDTVVLGLPTFELKEVFTLKPGAQVFLTRGKHGGALGVLKELKGKEAIYVGESGEVGTAREYLFVVGEKKPVIALS